MKRTHFSRLPLDRVLSVTGTRPFQEYWFDRIPFSDVSLLVENHSLEHPFENTFCKISPSGELEEVLLLQEENCLLIGNWNLSIPLEEASRQDLLAKARIDTRDRYESRRTINIGRMRCKIDERVLKQSNPRKRAFQFRFAYKGTLPKEYILSVELSAERIIKDIVYEMTEGDGKGKKLDASIMEKVLMNAFDSDDVKIDCTCPDFRYRFAYAATKHKFKARKPENRPSKITNPKARGMGCKHLIKLLSNPAWMKKCAILALSALRRSPMQLFFPYVAKMDDLKLLR